MIKSFRNKETERVFYRNFSSQLPQNLQRTALRKLWLIHQADRLNDLKVPPSNHLEKLTGDRKGEWSIRINRQWRICFEWEWGHAYDVEITDYH